MTTAFVMPEDAAKLFEEKLDRIRGEIGAAEKEKAIIVQDVDRLRDEAGKLERELDQARKQLETLTDKVLNGQQTLEEHRAKILDTLAKREEDVNARQEAAVEAERAAKQQEQTVRQLLAKVQGAKVDLLGEVASAADSVRAVGEQIAERLADI